MNLANARARLVRSLPTIGISIGIAALPLLALVVSNRLEGVRFSTMTRDPIVVLHGSVSTGILSTFGGLLWAAAVGASAVAAFRSDLAPPLRAHFRRGGLLTAWLMADDVFLFHERVIPVYVGIPETIVHAVYPVVCVWFLARGRREIFAGDWPTLGAALSFFAVSEICDALIGEDSDVFFLIEDGAKFVGIALWLVYFARSASARPSVAPA
jgi:hypothetical protein